MRVCAAMSRPIDLEPDAMAEPMKAITVAPTSKVLRAWKRSELEDKIEAKTA